MTHLEWLDDPSSERGIRFATHDGWDRWTWSDLAELSRRMACGLERAGVAPGDVVAFVERTGPRFVATLFGAMLAAAAPAPLAPPQSFHDPAQYAAYVRGLLAAARPSLLLTGAGLHDRLVPIATAAGVRTLALDAVKHEASDRSTRRDPAALALVQFTSGSSGRSRAVRIGAGALAANIDAIRRWLRLTPADATASWLPVHHDMGLIGCLLTPAATGSDIWLLSPEQFVRSPLRYLRCFGPGGARVSAMPGFGLDYVVRRVRPAALAGLDLRDWRAIIVGAERIDAGALERFHALLGPCGLRRSALLPAYGLAEATLAVTGLSLEDRWTEVELEAAPVALGQPVAAAAGAAARVVGCGSEMHGVQTAIHDEAGGPLDDGRVGEIVVSGACVADGYRVAGSSASATEVRAGVVRTGDAGFRRDGQLYVLGRLGDAIKVRGRHVFAEDIEAALAAAGISARGSAALLGDVAGTPTGVVVLEAASDTSVRQATTVLRCCAEHARIVVMDTPKGTIQRTTSGKPRRRELWDAFVQQRLGGDIRFDGPATPDDDEQRAHV